MCVHCQFVLDSSQGCISTFGGLILVCAHCSQLLTSNSMSLSTPDQPMYCHASRFILLMPGCIWCNSCRTVYCSIFGITILSFLKRVPSVILNGFSLELAHLVYSSFSSGLTSGIFWCFWGYWMCCNMFIGYL